MGVSYNPKVPINNMIVNIDVGNTKSYPGTGTTIRNLVNLNSNTGANVVGSPVYSSSNTRFFTLNGSTQYLTKSFNGAISNSSEISYSIWLRILSYPVGVNALLFGVEDTYVSSYLDAAGRLGFSFSFGTGVGYDFDNITQLPLNTWFNLSVTMSETTSALNYINGNLVGTCTAPPGALAGFTFYSVGATFSIPSNFANCNFAQLSIYNRVLSPVEVRQNFNALRGRFGI